MKEHFYRVTQEIDELIRSYSEDRSIKLLSVIRNDVALQTYLFDGSVNSQWFSTFKKAGYFNPKNNPAPIEEPKSSGYFRIPLWPVLNFLVRITESEKESLPDNIIEDIHEIITEISQYSKDKELDNPRTWASFVNTLTNIPNDKIRLEILDHIGLWLSSRFKLSLVDSDICGKLLPKFLESKSNKTDVEKAERIFESILDFEEKDKTELKSYKREFLIDDYWLREALLKNGIAFKLGKVCSIELIQIVCAKLKRFLDLDLSGKIKSRTRIRNHEYVFQAEDKFKRSFEISVNIETLQEQKGDSPANIGPIVIEDITEPKIFVQKVESLLNESDTFQPLISDLDLFRMYFHLCDDHSHIWYSSFGEYTMTLGDGIGETLTSIIYNLCLGRISDEKGTEDIVRMLLAFDKYPYAIYKRIAFQLVSEDWNTFKSIFWDEIYKPHGRYYLIDPNFQRSFDSMFRNNADKFDSSDREKIKKIIEAGPVYTYSKSEDAEDRVKGWKQRMYSSLKEISEFKDQYDKLKIERKVDEYIPDAKIATRVGRLSPLSMVQLRKMSVRAITEYFDSFKGENSFSEPDINGLADAIKADVIEDYAKYIENINAFVNAKYLLVYNLTSGISKLKSKNIKVDWEKLLKFFDDYLSIDEFGKDKLKIKDDTWQIDSNTVIGEIGSIIQEGNSDDEWAIGKSNIVAATNVLEKCYEKYIDKQFLFDYRKQQLDDPITWTLNSPMGKVLTATIYLSLWIARNDESIRKEKNKWTRSDLKDLFVKGLNEEKEDAYVLLGQYLPFLGYLDQVWLEEKIKELINPKGTNQEELWYQFMYGYLFNNELHKHTMKIMIPHYYFAIDHAPRFNNDKFTKRLAEHVSIGFMADLDEFSISKDEGMLKKVLDRWDSEEVNDLLSYFYKKPRTDAAKDVDKLTEKIVAIWKFVVNKCLVREREGKFDDEDRGILSYLSLLTLWIDKLDKNTVKWIKYVAPYVQAKFNTPSFLEQLTYYISREKNNLEQNALYLSEIYLELLKAGVTPDYGRVHIIQLVEYMYDHGNDRTKRNADSIIEKYARAQNHILKEIWEKNNRTTKKELKSLEVSFLSVIKEGLPPVVDSNTEVLILGTLPSDISIRRNQYYADKRNDFWKLLSNATRENLVMMDYSKRILCLLSLRIGLWDVFRSGERVNSMDKDISNTTLNDFIKFKSDFPKIQLVCLNGKTAGRYEEMFLEFGYNTLLLPSSSGVNRRNMSERQEKWNRILR